MLLFPLLCAVLRVLRFCRRAPPPFMQQQPQLNFFIADWRACVVVFEIRVHKTTRSLPQQKHKIWIAPHNHVGDRIFKSIQSNWVNLVICWLIRRRTHRCEIRRRQIVECVGVFTANGWLNRAECNKLLSSRGRESSQAHFSYLWLVQVRETFVETAVVMHEFQMRFIERARHWFQYRAVSPFRRLDERLQMYPPKGLKVLKPNRKKNCSRKVSSGR